MLGSIDLVRLLYRPVIEPQNDVAIIAVFVVKVGPGYWDWFVCIVSEDGEGACGVEANTAYSVLVDVVLVKCPTDRRANASPNVRRGLFLSQFSFRRYALLKAK